MTENLTSTTFVLSMLNAARNGDESLTPNLRHGVLSSVQLVCAGGVLEFDPQSIRMALSRLKKENKVSLVNRGKYELSESYLAVNTFIGSWRQADSYLKNWTGRWRVVLTAALGRRDKKTLKRREWILVVFGFLEAQRDVWVRPDNLKLSGSELFKLMTELGLSERALQFTVTDVSEDKSAQWSSLWSHLDLEDVYESELARLEQSKADLVGKSTIEVARQTYLTGQDVIKTINRDPLLPSQLCDQDKFIALLSSMKSYDKIGRKAWRKFFQSLEK